MNLSSTTTKDVGPRVVRTESRAAWATFAVIGLMAHALLLSGALAAWPAAVRVLIAALVTFLVPGFAFVRLGLRPPGGMLLAPGWALGFGVAWNAALVLLVRAAGRPVTGLEHVSWATTALLWGVALLAPRRAQLTAPERQLPIGRVAAIATLVAAAAGFSYVGWHGAVDTLASDSPDHIGTIRRIMISGDAFPRDAFFRDAGVAGVDPRKGVWHPQVAVVARLASVDPHLTWRWLAVMLAPLFVLNIAALGLLAGGSPGMAIAAWMTLLTLGGTLEQSLLREAVYSSRVANQLAFAATAAVLADLMRPGWSFRLAAMLLGFGAMTSHLFAVVHLAIPLGTLGLLLLIRDRGPGPQFRRLLGTSLVLAAGVLPFLLWRAQQAYAPENVIHTAPQGLMYLSGNWRIMSPGFLWTTFSWTWVLVPLLWVPLWRSGRREPVAVWMLGATIAAALMTLNPLMVAVLEPRVGYLIPRFLGFVPIAVILAWGIPFAWRLVQGPGRRAGVALLAVIAVTLLPAVRDALTIVPRRARFAQTEWREGAGAWIDALKWMDAHLAPDEVVLSDPVTSYSIPMMTGRYVATLVDQHSSPNDPHALDRLLDARDALDPYSSWARVREVVNRYGVDAIALNDRFVFRQLLDYWGPTPEWFAAVRARLDRHPDTFPIAFDSGDFVVYRIDRASLDSLSAEVPRRPGVERWREGAFPPGVQLDPGMPVIHGVRLDRDVLAAGDTLHAVALWRALSVLKPGSYHVAVRLDRPMPDGFRPPAFLGKPWRKLVETLRDERYRLRSNHLPAGGTYGVDRWRPDEVVLDPFDMRIPTNAMPGDYVLRLRMIRQPHYANTRLSDYFFDEDLFSGVPVARVRITPPEAADEEDRRGNT